MSQKITVRRAGRQVEERRERMEAYLEWCLTPRGERQPSSKQKYADEFGVTVQTLRNYQRDPWFQTEFQKRGRQLARVERAADVVDRLYQLATDPDTSPGAAVSAAKAFLDWTDQTVEDLSVGDLLEMSFDEMRDLIDEAERKAH